MDLDQLLSLTHPSLVLLQHDNYLKPLCRKALHFLEGYAKKQLQSFEDPSLAMILTFLETHRFCDDKQSIEKELAGLTKMAGQIQDINDLQFACSGAYREEQFKEVL